MSAIGLMDEFNEADALGVSNETVIQVVRPALDRSSTGNLSVGGDSARAARGGGRGYSQKFRPQWQQEPLFRDWLMPVIGDQYMASCRICGTTLRAHRKLLLMHCASQKHLQRSGRSRTRRGGGRSRPASRETDTAVLSEPSDTAPAAIYTDDALTSGLAAVASDILGDANLACDVIQSADDVTGWSPLAGLRVGFIGAGNIAQALARGILDRQLTTADNIVVSAASERRYELWRRWGCQVAVDDGNNQVFDECDLVFVAVPSDALPSLSSSLQRATYSGKASLDNNTSDRLALSSQCVLSLVGGVERAHVEQVLSMRNSFSASPPDVSEETDLDEAGQTRRCARRMHVVRCVVSSPVMIGDGCCLYYTSGLPKRWHTVIEGVFSSLGACRQVSEERLLTVSAGLVCSGPALVYSFIDALTAGGVRAGVPRTLARALAAQTVLAGARMVLETGSTPAELCDEAASPGGATSAALMSLEKNSLRYAVMAAVSSATEHQSLAADCSVHQYDDDDEEHTDKSVCNEERDC